MFIVITQSLTFICATNAQSKINFSYVDKFEIPEKNCSISFSSNGTYDLATLKNNFWTFESLQLSNSEEIEKLHLEVSGKDCEIIINSYFIYNRTINEENIKRAVLRYSAFGSGTQIFNLGLDPNMGSFDARLNGEWVGLNNGWTVSSDGTYKITEPATNVTLLYYGYPDSFRNKPNFFEGHSVLISSILFFVIVLVSAVILKKKIKISIKKEWSIIL